MTQTACLQHPESSRFIQLHKWQVEFCQGNNCAALLLSHFSCWHDWKILNDQYYRRYNDIAEAHGEGRPHNEHAYLFFTTDDLLEALMGFYGKKSITDGLDLLISMGVISVHKNPNPRYCFDKTKYFKFFPEVCNKWLQENYSLNKNTQNNTQAVDNFHNTKVDDRLCKTARPSSENGRPSCKNGQAITNNTNNTTNNNQSTRAREESISGLQASWVGKEEIKSIIADLVKQGMPVKRFYPDAIDDIHRLYQEGATKELFIKAYDYSVRATQGHDFGVPYLVKAAKDLLAKKSQATNGKDPPRQKPKDCFSETVYESDTRNAQHWIKDKNHAHN